MDGHSHQNKWNLSVAFENSTRSRYESITFRTVMCLFKFLVMTHFIIIEERNILKEAMKHDSGDRRFLKRIVFTDKLPREKV